MAELNKQEKVVVNGNEEEGEETRLLEGMAALDFDMLCSTVASQQTQGKWREIESSGEENAVGVLRMWEGEVVLDFMYDRRVALESACCPCYRFGKNMKRAGFGYCLLQGTVYFILLVSVFLNIIAFVVTDRNCFLYLAVAFTVSLGAYSGFFRMQIKRKFNIMGTDNLLDDCIYHLICPCCTLSQVLVPTKLCLNFLLISFIQLASFLFGHGVGIQTLEMNNVQDGTWHGRGDICIGSHSEGSRPFFELHHPHPISIKIPEPCSMQNGLN